MRTVDEFLTDVLQHEYDPVKAREYYLRTRKLKGRKRKRVEEDEVPMKSRTGAKLVDFDGANGGRAVYEDGSTYDGDGWDSDTKGKGRGLDRSERFSNVQKGIDSVRASVLKNIKDPAKQKARLAQLDDLQRRTNAAKAKAITTRKPTAKESSDARAAVNKTQAAINKLRAGAKNFKNEAARNAYLDKVDDMQERLNKTKTRLKMKAGS